MATRAELEAAIDAAPDSAERHQVYSDFLVELGDPLGELSQVRRAAETRPDDRRLSEHLSALFSRVVPDDLRRAGPTFRHGFIDGVALQDHGLSLERAPVVLALPCCRFVRRLFVTIGTAVDAAWVGRLRTLLSSLPRVTSVGIRVAAVQPPQRLLSALPAQLKSLQLQLDKRPAGVLQSLGDPAPLDLETLTIAGWLGPWEARVLNARRPSAGARCQLRLPRAGFRVDASLTAWPGRVRTPSTAPALLVVAPASEAGIRLSLDAAGESGAISSWRIGKAPECDLAITEAGLKPVHAVVTRRETAYAIRPADRDGRSVWVNGTAVPTAGRPLVDGDRIRAGTLELRYAREADEAWDAAYERWQADGR